MVSAILVSLRGARRRPRRGSQRGSGQPVGPEGAVPAPGAGGGLSMSHGLSCAKRGAKGPELQEPWDLEGSIHSGELETPKGPGQP